MKILHGRASVTWQRSSVTGSATGNRALVRRPDSRERNARCAGKHDIPTLPLHRKCSRLRFRRVKSGMDHNGSFSATCAWPRILLHRRDTFPAFSATEGTANRLGKGKPVSRETQAGLSPADRRGGPWHGHPKTFARPCRSFRKRDRPLPPRERRLAGWTPPDKTETGSTDSQRPALPALRAFNSPLELIERTFY